MTVRLVDAVRLYNMYRIPVIISGGGVGSNDKESVVVKRFLIDLGVNPGDIVIEDRSRDTVENALYVKEIFQKMRFKRGLLITSAYHIRRAKYLFNKTGLMVLPHSSGPLSEKGQSLNLYDFLPNIHNLSKTAIALRETIGMIFYYFKYEIFQEL